MKYCKKCGVLYTTDVCPKCGIVAPEEETPKQASKEEVRRNWIALIIAIPATILLIMGIITVYMKFVY